MDFTYLETLSSPSRHATHLSLSSFPKLSITSGCGFWVVYICPDPKDAFMSWWCYENKVHRRHSTIDLKIAFNMFSEGFSGYGPFWDHCLEVPEGEHYDVRQGTLLKVRLSGPVKRVMKMAAFVGVPFSTKEEEDGVPEEMVRLCSFFLFFLTNGGQRFC